MLKQILHGEQYLEVFQALPTDGILTTRGKVIDIMDKTSGAVVVSQGTYTFIFLFFYHNCIININFRQLTHITNMAICYLQIKVQRL